MDNFDRFIEYLSSLTNEELKEQLKQHGVNFKKNNKKDDKEDISNDARLVSNNKVRNISKSNITK